jgi:hypothetical protein
MDCYNDLLPKEALRFPANKIIRKTVGDKDREHYWMHDTTGERSSAIPFKKVPLNPDAFHPNNEIINVQR